MTKIHRMFVLAATALALSTLPGRAGPCAQDIDRAWAQVDAKIHARIAAGRSLPQSTIGLLHHQPTPDSVVRPGTGSGACSVRTLWKRPPGVVNRMCDAWWKTMILQATLWAQPYVREGDF